MLRNDFVTNIVDLFGFHSMNVPSILRASPRVGLIRGLSRDVGNLVETNLKRNLASAAYTQRRLYVAGLYTRKYGINFLVNMPCVLNLLISI